MRVLMMAAAMALCMSTGVAADDDDDDRKITICHVPRGNPSARHTISVGERAVDAHLDHGDYLGRCGGGGRRVGKDDDGYGSGVGKNRDGQVRKGDGDVGKDDGYAERYDDDRNESRREREKRLDKRRREMNKARRERDRELDKAQAELRRNRSDRWADEKYREKRREIYDKYYEKVEDILADTR